MGSSPKFSIITVCRNEEKSIRKTCESVCSQNFTDFEWIVIDGKSTDGTLEILLEYKDRISVFISESDWGIYNAMNKGVARATGEYLVFMNGGDRFSDSDVLSAVAGAPQKDIIFGDLLSGTVDGSLKRKYFSDVPPAQFLRKRMMPHQATYIKRELFERYGSYDESYVIAGDYDLFVRFLFVNGVDSVHIDRPLAFFAGGGTAGRSEMAVLRRSENHRIRFNHFSCYRFSAKGLLYQIVFKIVGALTSPDRVATKREVQS